MHIQTYLSLILYFSQLNVLYLYQFVILLVEVTTALLFQILDLFMLGARTIEANWALVIRKTVHFLPKFEAFVINVYLTWLVVLNTRYV